MSAPAGRPRTTDPSMPRAIYLRESEWAAVDAAGQRSRVVREALAAAGVLAGERPAPARKAPARRTTAREAQTRSPACSHPIGRRIGSGCGACGEAKV